MPPEPWQDRLRLLYEGHTLRSVRFRYTLLALDIVTVLFIVATSFMSRTRIIEALDVVFGIWIFADFSARLLVSRQRLKEFTHVATWTDIVVIISFLMPFSGEAGGFLRPLRTLTLLRDSRMAAQLQADSPFFRRNEEVIFAATTLVVFTDRQLCRRALFYGYCADDDRFRRYHPAGHGGPLDNGRHHDIRRDAVPESCQGAVDAIQSPIPMPDLWAAAP
jgi:voltage-gated potassium channel